MVAADEEGEDGSGALAGVAGGEVDETAVAPRYRGAVEVKRVAVALEVAANDEEVEI